MIDRAERARLAEAAMVAICAQLSMVVVRDERFAHWHRALQGVLADVPETKGVMAPMRDAAWGLAMAEGERAIGNALARLKIETAAYYREVAALRVSQWSDASGWRFNR
ncbi:MAG: hypothetical protein KDK24_20295 [Pseudooceanicola sp.]|nr:hypothetical protein [Pseudooceanicola sp.]